MKRQVGKRVTTFVLAFALMATSLGISDSQSVEAAKKATLKTKSITVTVGNKKSIALKNKAKKATYSYTSKSKKIATVTKKGVVTGKKAGNTTITVKEKLKKKSRTVGKVKVKVNAKKTVTTEPVQTQTPIQTSAPAPATEAPKVTDTPSATVTPTETPAPTDEPITGDVTDGITWPEAPITEEFESEAAAVIKNSEPTKSTYVATGGVNDSGYLKVGADQYNGPTFFLDNRTGTASRKFFISAYVKADDTDGLYSTVSMWGGNKYETSEYLTGKYATTASRKLSADWELIKGVCTVPAGKFTEIRMKNDSSAWDIDHLVIKDLEDSDDTEMAPDPVEPGPSTFLSDTFTMSPVVATDGWEYTKEEDGSYTIKDSWRYMLVELPDYVDMSSFVSIALTGSISAKYRITVFDKYKNNLMGENQFIYMNDAVTSKATVGISATGYAKYLFIGSCSAGEDLKVNLTSIKFNAKASTDGLTETNKEVGNNNPIATQRFTADPYAMEYDGTVYVYGTNDSEQLVPNDDGEYIENDYTMIKSLNCYSSKDMVNWTDEGTIKVGGADGASSWASNSWAPAACHKTIDGKEKFFIYYANSANSIGVLTSDSPTGPWVDPIGKPLIDRSTPGCSNSEVSWLFDPAVLVDDDGTGYLYFGGGYPDGSAALPGTERAVKLSDDMVHLAGDPVQIKAPFAFEDSGINKIGDTYYYSYCTNFSTEAAASEYGTGTIVYMISKDPLTGWVMGGKMLDNPGTFFPGTSGNNHHCMLEVDGSLYMFYHTMKYGNDMGLPNGYRTTNVDKVTFKNDAFDISMTETGVVPIKTLDPYATTEAETFAWSVGTSTLNGPEQEDGANRVLSSINTGDYVGIANADFGDDGAKSVSMSIANPGAAGTVKVYIDDMTSTNLVARLSVKSTGADDEFADMTCDLGKTVTGNHKIFFVFNMDGIFVDTWQFSKDALPTEEPEKEIVCEVNKLSDISGDETTYNCNQTLSLASYLPEEFDVADYAACKVDATFYSDTEGTTPVSQSTLSALTALPGKCSLDDGTHEVYQDGVVAAFGFGMTQGTYVLPLDNFRSNGQPTKFNYAMKNRTDIQSIKINTLTFVPKTDITKETKVDINDAWDLTASQYNNAHELSFADKLPADFNVADYDYCTIDAEFYSDTACTEVLDEDVLNALPYGGYNCTGKITIGDAASNVWGTDNGTTTYNFGRTQKGYDITLSPYLSSEAPAKLLYVMYPTSLETMKSIKIKSITFKKL